MQMQDPKKSPKIAIWAPSNNFVGLYLRNYGTYQQSEKSLLSSNISPTCPHNMVNFGLLAAEILSLVWGTPGNFNGFRVLASLLHGTLVVGVSQTAALNRGRIHIRQGGHHVGHWPTFLVLVFGPYRIFGLGKTMLFIVGLRIDDVGTSVDMIDYPRIGCVQTSLDFGKLEMWATAQPDGRPAEYR